MCEYRLRPYESAISNLPPHMSRVTGGHKTRVKVSNDHVIRWRLSDVKSLLQDGTRGYGVRITVEKMKIDDFSLLLLRIDTDNQHLNL